MQGSDDRLATPLQRADGILEVLQVVSKASEGGYMTRLSDASSPPFSQYLRTKVTHQDVVSHLERLPRSIQSLLLQLAERCDCPVSQHEIRGCG